MSIADFSALRRTNMPFVASSHDEWAAYLAWCQEQLCSGCGACYADRPRDAAGNALDQWATETECWSCFVKRSEASTMSIAELLPALLQRITALRERCLSSANRPSAEEIAADLSQLEADLVRLQTTVRADTSAKVNTATRGRKSSAS